MDFFLVYCNRICKKIALWASDNWMSLSFFSLALILPLIWFSIDVLYAPEEILFANYQIIFDKFLYSWGDKLNYGTPASPEIASLVFPNAIFYKFLSTVGISNHIIQILYLQLYIFVIFLAISHLLKIFTSDKRIIVIGSLIYFFNYYTYQALAYSAKMSQMILLPVFFYLMYQYLVTKKFRYVALNFIALFLLQNIFTNLPQAVSTFIVYFIAVVYFIITEKYNVKDFLIKYTIKIALFFIFLLPVILYHAMVYYFSLIENIENIGKYFGFSALTAPLHLIFQLRGSWGEYGFAEGVPYNHWLSFYDNKWVILVAVFIFIVAFVPILNKKRLNMKYLFLASIFLFSIFLASGSSFAPNLFLLIYKNFPFFYIFREPWAKFMPLIIFSFSVLIAITFNKIMTKKIFYLFIILILIKSLNFFSPNFFDHSNDKWKKIFIKPPAYRYEYFNWTKDNKNKYVLNIPFFDNSGNSFQYDWYTHNLGNSNVSINFIFDQSNAVREKPGYSHISKFNKVAEYFDEIKSLEFIKLGTVNYLLKQDDLVVSGKSEKEFNFDSIEKYFEDIPEVSFGDKLSLYKIKSEFFIPHLYIPESVILSHRPVDYITKIVLSESFNIRTPIFIKDQNPLKDDQLNEIDSFSKNEKNYMEFKKINPTKYKVFIHNATDKFPLIFLENYNKHWKTYLIKKNEKTRIYQTWFKKSLSEEDHLMVNGYANSWIINTDEVCNPTSPQPSPQIGEGEGFCTQNPDGSYDFEMVVEFWPQRLFYVGVGISGATLLACLIYLAYDFRKRRKQKQVIPLDSETSSE